MPYDVCNTAQVTFPSAGNGVSSTAAASWADGTWVELTADSGASDLYLTCVIAQPSTTYFAAEFEIEVGVGAAGNEVALATWHTAQNTYSAIGPLGTFPTVLPIDALPAHSRIVARSRRSTSGGTWTFLLSVACLVKPASPTLETSTAVIKTLPSKAAGTTVATHATAWTWGNWVQFVASTANAIDLVGLWAYRLAGTSAGWIEFQIGVGAAGSEVEVLTVAVGEANAAEYSTDMLEFQVPPRVPTSTRLAVRSRRGSNNALNHTVVLHYRDAP
jgi:hypothetical protein